MKKILFVIDSLTIGGAEKSLITLLTSLNPSNFEVDLLLFKQGGEFERYLPSYVNIIPMPDYFNYLQSNKVEGLTRLKYMLYRYKTSMNLRINTLRKKKLHSEQIVYKNIQTILHHPYEKKYDIAIAYSQGMPTYFVANKVKADKKIAWVNTDYENTLYDKQLDLKSYQKVHYIVAVSQNTKKSIANVNTEYSSKIKVIRDIVDPTLIRKMAKDYRVSEFTKDTVNILTVGRLEVVKGYDKAIYSAKKLKEAGCKFKWFAIGEGVEKDRLKRLVEKLDLSNEFIFLGKKVNPYPYMKNCDIYVQTSIKEGFGLTISEAKILERPIVCTNFPTATKIIKNGVDGLLVEHDVDDIYLGIQKILEDGSFRERMIQNLCDSKPYNTKNEIKKFYELVEKKEG